jgi:hypothetical protein
MKALLISFLAVLLVGCQAPRSATHPLVYSGGDGSSCDQAVVIREAKCRELGVLAQRLWLEDKFPGYREAKQSAINSADRHYDIVEFATASGDTRKVYFDTTDCFDR